MFAIPEILARLKEKWRLIALTIGVLFIASNIASCVSNSKSPLYAVTTLIPPSPFHGVNGLAARANGDLYAVSMNGRAIFQVRKDGRTTAGPVRLAYGATDIAIGPSGAIAWTQSERGAVYYRDASGKTRRVLKDAKGAQGLAFAPDGTLYVSQNGGVDALWQIDLSGVAPLRRIAQNIGQLRGFVFGADGLIYGALSGAKAVAKLDPKSGNVLQSITGYLDPVAVGFGPENTLYAVDGGEGAIDRVEFDRGLSVRAAWVRTGAEDIAVDSQGIAYIAVPPDDTISRIDLRTHTVGNLTRGRLGAPSDIGILADADGDVLAVADQFALRTVEMNTGEVTDWMRARANPLSAPAGIGAGRRWILLANPADGEVTVIDRNTRKTVATLRGYSEPIDAVETDDGRFAILDSSVGELSLASAPDGAERRTIAKGLNQPSAMITDGQGGLYVTETSAGRVVRVDLKTGAVKIIAKDLSRPEGIGTAPDGKIVVAEAGAKRVIAIEVTSGKRQVLAENLDMGSTKDAPLLVSGIAVDQDGAVFVTSGANNGLYKLTPH